MLTSDIDNWVQAVQHVRRAFPRTSLSKAMSLANAHMGLADTYVEIPETRTRKRGGASIIGDEKALYRSRRVPQWPQLAGGCSCSRRSGGCNCKKKRMRGGRCLSAAEKKIMFPHGVPNLGPFSPDPNACNWDDRNIVNEVKATFNGMKRTWKDDPTGLVKYFKEIPYLGQAGDAVFGGRRRRRKGKGVREVWNTVKKTGKKVVDTVKKYATPENIDKAIKVTKIIGSWVAPASMPKAIASFLKSYEGWSIKDIQVCRVPIIKAIDVALRAAAGSGYNVDQFFHTYLIMTLSKDNQQKMIKVERNQTFQIKDATSADYKQITDHPDVEGEGCMKVSIKAPVLLTTAFEKFEAQAKRDNPEFGAWRYSALKNNCQMGVRSFLRGIGAWNNSLDKFVMQPLDKLIPSLSDKLQDVAQGITDIAGGVTNLAGGKKRRAGGFRAQREMARPRIDMRSLPPGTEILA